MLRYLWIKDYNNIQNQGFLFDSELEVSYEPETGELTLKKEPLKRMPAKFYGKNIELVTGVLGENGAGKSTLIAAIMQMAGSFANGASSSTPPWLFIFGNTVVHEAEVKLSNGKALEKIGYRVYKYKDNINFYDLTNVANSNGPDPITQHAYIHYSNFFESSWQGPAFGVIDVSTAYLFEDINLRDATLTNEKTDSLTTYRTRNFFWEVRALNYLRTNSKHSLPFATPRFLSIEAKDVEKVYQATLDDAFFKTVEIESLRELSQEFMRRIQNAGKRPAIEEFIARFILPRIFVLIRVYNKAFLKFTREEFSGLSDMEAKPRRINEPGLDEQLNTLYEFVQFLREESDAKHVFPFPERQRYGGAITRLVKLDISAVPQEKLIRLLTQISYTVNNAQTFEAHWAGLSSGQAAYLRLYARLFQASDSVQDSINVHHKNINSLTILVDEGETGFHPQWQKQFIKLLLGIIEDLFADFQVQLIVCSNSPFIASDIPQTNLLLLHRRDDGSCEVKPWGGREKTFAANIHTLLTESFFMPDGLMGDFAREKVGKLIGYLQHKRSAQDAQREEMRAVLDMIGEPLIRMKLHEMWAENFGLTEQIEEMERQLAILRRQQENG